jgi:hypothetical protein
MSEIERYDPFDGKLGFALANRVGDNVYVSGMTGIEYSDQQVPDGIEAQARLAYKNIESILSQFGASLADSIEHPQSPSERGVVAETAFGRDAAAAPPAARNDYSSCPRISPARFWIVCTFT